ncbi:MAG TPA: HlyD family efflux transporter periplasmic adaptor subunit [bacterium]|nr:HlyD family efflux transporter periplasmic adaptor subunit [bacterium]
MAADAPRSRPPRRSVLGVTALALAVVGLVAWAGWRFFEGRASTDRLFASGSIQATEIDVSPKVAGRIIRLVVNEGDRVRAAQVLAELEPQEATAQVTQAQAAVAQAEAQVAQGQQAVLSQQQVTTAQVSQAAAQVAAAGTGVPQSETALAIQEQTSREAVAAAEAQLRAAQAQVGSARSALVTARNNLSRQRTLFAEGAVAATQVDAVQAAYDAAVAQNQSAADAVTQAQAAVASARANLMQVEIQRKAVEAARANLAQAEAGLRSAESGYAVVAQRRQALAAAQAALAQTRANLDYVRVIAGHNVIVAPRDAVVQTRNVEEGEVVAAGTPLYRLIDLRDIWLRAYVPQDQIARVKVGQVARVSIDSFPGRVFEGRVEEVSNRGEFTPGNVQTREDRVKLAFSVKIRLTNSDDRLKPGTPADAEIVVGTEPGGPAR